MLRKDDSYKIISNKNIGENFYEMKVEAGLISKHCKPGQFFMINAPGLFLRRPISIHNVNANIISFLYNVIGNGTKAISKMKKGDSLEMLGALGNGYPENLSTFSVMIAGGTGIASLYFLAKSFHKKGFLFYGTKTSKDLICLDKIKKLNWKVFIATQDGSAGYKGLITNLFEKFSMQLDTKSTLYICGPNPMTQKVIEIAIKKDLQGYASLEQKMACGLGNCQGCAVKIKGQNKMVCKDGTVFDIRDIQI
jgi:dihydroorotate dehydrogenase electron transfer subunit